MPRLALCSCNWIGSAAVWAQFTCCRIDTSQMTCKLSACLKWYNVYIFLSSCVLFIFISIFTLLCYFDLFNLCFHYLFEISIVLYYNTNLEGLLLISWIYPKCAPCVFQCWLYVLYVSIYVYIFICINMYTYAYAICIYIHIPINTFLYDLYMCINIYF